MRLAASGVSLLLWASAFLAPAFAESLGCYEDQYVVIPVGAGWADIRGLFGVGPPTEFFPPSVWIYLEAGGDANHLDRGDDHDITALPADAGFCGQNQLPPVVDDLLVALRP